ncbi:PREDICTED: disks large-associated protein 5-like [Dufourea novaeangliae]|uniref:Disks large-associated protein 5 n=1 Tax=Dufourea novaeangliae TaxID=178035 RepID=A0A154PMU9_DUFNO|nr:PREDICTED: disks large-associated protein 5-like [Dufourea novaeangliae]KZC12784.1 Disks large-associated protein 5 [Dufourea novaeangliae]
MTTFRDQYKEKTFGFGDNNRGRIIRAEKHEKLRKNQRVKIFNENRNILNPSANSTLNEEPEVPHKADRMTRLLKWKADRDRRKRMESLKKKPAFVVGIVHHKIYSPIAQGVPVTSVGSHKNVCDSNVENASSTVKRITRATEKRLRYKARLKEVTKLSIKGSEPDQNKKHHVSAVLATSFVPEGHTFKPPEGLPHIQLFGRESYSMSFNNTPKTNIGSNVEVSEVLNNSTKNTPAILDNSAKGTQSSSNNNTTPKSVNPNLSSEPVFYSPYVVSSRGKSNARKEQQIKRGFSLSRSTSDEIPTKDTVMKGLNISIEAEERTAQYFKFLLNREIDRLNELCDKWRQVKEELGITEDGQYLINQAIGQTNLLISKKFERFRSLVSNCETGKGERLVTCNDLQGFWDIVHMEIENCDLRFEKLEQLRSKGWEEEQLSVVSKPVVKKKTVTKKKTVSTKPSSIRAFLTKRKEKMTKKAQNDNSMEEPEILENKISSNKDEKNENSPNVKYKTRRSIGSTDTKFSSIKHDKTRLSLLQKVQLSETKKHKSPLIVMKISQMCKTPEIQLDETISYVNSGQTPGKSILKQSKNTSEVECHAKSTHKVNFNDTVVLNEVPINEETQVKMDLAAALVKIDSIDFDSPTEDVPIHAERKLTYDDGSFEDSANIFDMKKHCEVKKSTKDRIMKLPSVKVTTATPLQGHSSPSNSSRRRTLRRQNAMDESVGSRKSIVASTPFKENADTADENIRILRNRAITSTNTSKEKSRFSRQLSISVPESDHKENNNSEINICDAIGNVSLHEKSEKSKSRRSVKFSGEKCSICVEKVVFPLTPHTKRNKKQISEEEKNIASQDSTSHETSETPPERIRRSRNRKTITMV